MILKTVCCLMLVMMLSGCIHQSAALQREATEVPVTKQGRDCILVFFGLSYGAATIEQAMRNGIPFGTDEAAYSVSLRLPSTPIQRVRTAALTDSYFLVAGNRCLVVTGD